MPEWIAGWWIKFVSHSSEDELPIRTIAWQKKPELQLATMNLRELRQLARKLRLNSYSNESRDRLSQRLLKHMSKKLQKELPNKAHQMNTL